MITYTTDTGREVSFASEAAQQAALDWYNSEDRAKGDFVGFLKAHAPDTIQPDGTLAEDWADVAMELYAQGKR